LHFLQLHFLDEAPRSKFSERALPLFRSKNALALRAIPGACGRRLLPGRGARPRDPPYRPSPMATGRAWSPLVWCSMTMSAKIMN
jgi:hypothetical protein